MRVPLYAKVMVSYLLVVGLVVVPMLVYLKSGLEEELRGVVRKDLEDQLTLLSARLARTPTDRLQAEADAMVDRLPQRVTIIADDGVVLADSVLREPEGEGRTLENHGSRPEIVEAREKGTGSAIRTSATTGHTFLYCAKRFPAEGPVRGFVRLAVKLEAIDAAAVKVLAFLNQSGAIALSAAVILSFVAALVVSRPLRRIAEAARAFAAGDFGHSVGVKSNDELGAVGQALGELASQLRGRLVEAGADRATLRGLLDELPVGVVLYDPSGAAVAVNTRTRMVCALSASDELERARQIAELPGQAAAVKRVTKTRITEELALELPWRPGASLRARWVATAASSGAAQVALIVLDGAEGEALRERLQKALAACVARLSAVAAEPATPLAGDCARTADEAARLLSDTIPAPAGVTTVAVGELCRRAREAVLAGVGRDAPEIALELAEGSVLVADADGTGARALRGLLASALERVGAGGRLSLRGQIHATKVRLSVSVPGDLWRPEPPSAALSALGGEHGVTTEGGATEAWVALPRA
jgi:HAMP domain-containing protein